MSTNFRSFLASERKKRLDKHARIAKAFTPVAARRFMDTADVRVELELQAEYPHIYRALREREV